MGHGAGGPARSTMDKPLNRHLALAAKFQLRLSNEVLKDSLPRPVPALVGEKPETHGAQQYEGRPFGAAMRQLPSFMRERDWDTPPVRGSFESSPPNGLLLRRPHRQEFRGIPPLSYVDREGAVQSTNGTTCELQRVREGDQQQEHERDQVPTAESRQHREQPEVNLPVFRAPSRAPVSGSIFSLISRQDVGRLGRSPEVQSGPYSAASSQQRPILPPKSSDACRSGSAGDDEIPDMLRAARGAAKQHQETEHDMRKRKREERTKKVEQQRQLRRNADPATQSSSAPDKPARASRTKKDEDATSILRDLERKRERHELTEEERRQLRVLKNRESAMKSLQKKRNYTESLEAKVEELKGDIRQRCERVVGLAHAVQTKEKGDEDRLELAEQALLLAREAQAGLEDVV